MRKFNATEPMRHADIVNTDRLGDTEFRSSFMPSEAASAVSEFGQDEPPQALTVSPRGCASSVRCGRGGLEG